MKAKPVVISAVISLTLLFFIGNFFLAVQRMNFSGDAGNIVSYVRGSSALTAILLPDELSHLEEVKFLVSKAFIAFYIVAAVSAALLAYIFLKRRKDFVNTLLYSSIAVFAACILLALISVDFSPFFTLFHRIFFPGGNWTFPEGTKLVTLFSEEFFRRFFVRLLFNTAIQSIALLLIVAPFSGLLATLKKRIKFLQKIC
jgi:integral membrane protein (TIGR01906 family)